MTGLIDSEEKRRYFLDALRKGRNAALRNAQDFNDVLFAVEQLGFFLTDGRGHGGECNFGGYQNAIVAFARANTPLAAENRSADGLTIPFERLYEMVRWGRNDALHQGTVARYLTQHAVELALILEDALMSKNQKIREFMVNGVVCAENWHPLSFIRRTMLEYDFSYLPVKVSDDPAKPWRLISDARLASWLRVSEYKVREKRLAMPLRLAHQGDLLEDARYLAPTADIRALLDCADTHNGRPALVVENEGKPDVRLVGVIMPFDVL